MVYHLRQCEHDFNEKIFLASSKSESNRAIIINALTGFKGELKNLSAARDTQTMLRLISSTDEIADVLDAGTTMRFLTAYFAITNASKTMTGTPRMCERPIGILTDALEKLGVEIEYLQENGFPPVKIKGFKTQKTNKLSIRGDVSSQYISALLMIAPTLPDGLELELTGEIGSMPYIKMTIAQMLAFGVMVEEKWDEKLLIVKPQSYVPSTYHIESDWSGASYWYSVVALSPYENTKIELVGLHENSLQGDSVIVDMMLELGVKSTFTTEGVLLEKIPAKENFSWDFTNCPDLAQTIAVVLVAKNIFGIFTGVESLKIKETDRILAIQNELAKIGGTCVEVVAYEKYEISRSKENLISSPIIDTYDDHRMAMAFAPLAMCMPLSIEDPGVVAKSYPSFWADLSKIISIENYEKV
jgi:3-phosphoshikimate 1-carboxyvinyltransferase